MRKQSILKAEINGFRATSHRVKDGTMLNLVKEVSKKVLHPSTQKDVVRKCKVSFNAVDPKSEDWLEDALAICGGDSALAAKVFNFGLWRFLQQQETNRLGKTDEMSKGLQKAIAGFVAMGMTAENARTMILANPDLSAKLANAKFEQFVETTVEDFAEYQKSANAEGVVSSRYPDITDVGGDDTETEGEEK